MPPRARNTNGSPNPNPNGPAPRRRARVIRNAATGAVFSFEHDGETYQLPSAALYTQNNEFTGGDFMDAVLDGDVAAELKMGLSVLKAARDDIHPDAYAAIRAKSVPDFMAVMGEWLQASGPEAGK